MGGRGPGGGPLLGVPGPPRAPKGPGGGPGPPGLRQPTKGGAPGPGPRALLGQKKALAVKKPKILRGGKKTGGPQEGGKGKKRPGPPLKLGPRKKRPGERGNGGPLVGKIGSFPGLGQTKGGANWRNLGNPRPRKGKKWPPKTAADGLRQRQRKKAASQISGGRKKGPGGKGGGGCGRFKGWKKSGGEGEKGRLSGSINIGPIWEKCPLNRREKRGKGGKHGNNPLLFPFRRGILGFDWGRGALGGRGGEGKTPFGPRARRGGPPGPGPGGDGGGEKGGGGMGGKKKGEKGGKGIFLSFSFYKSFSFFFPFKNYYLCYKKFPPF